MDQKSTHSETHSSGRTTDRLTSVSDPLNRGKDAIADAAHGVAKSAGSDLAGHSR
jgi:hypothetical protein